MDALVCGNSPAIVPDVASAINDPYFKRMYSYYVKLKEQHAA